MTKTELSELLHDCDVAVNEWESSDENKKKSERIVYWPYIEEDVMASGDDYEERHTYQISIFSHGPNPLCFSKLKQALRNEGLHPRFYREYNREEGIYHIYCALEVIV